MKSLYSVFILTTFFAISNIYAQGDFRKDIAYIINEQGQMVETRLPILAFLPSSSFDFGTVEEGSIVEHEFTIMNTGKSPLIITQVKGTCYCTAADWTKTPILPNEKGSVKLIFDTKGKSGKVGSSVNIYSNGFYQSEEFKSILGYLKGFLNQEVSKIYSSCHLYIR